jgi:hypothetical protein
MSAFMCARERRPITLFDLMMLVAATAVGLSLVQFGWPRKVAGAWIFTWRYSRCEAQASREPSERKLDTLRGERRHG